MLTLVCRPARSRYKPYRPPCKSSCMCSSQVMHTCWVRDPDERPSFEELKAQLEELWMELRQDDMKRQNQGERLVSYY